MARPSKAVEVLESEKRSHRTKAEIKQRKKAEQGILTGLSMKERPEVCENPVSHAEFLRVRKLMIAVRKNDALYESVINDYCEYKADIARYREMRRNIEEAISELKAEEIDPVLKYKMKSQMYGKIMECDKQIQIYQKKRFDIEKENGFTLASSLRSIPKAPEPEKNPILEALRDGSDE